ncbi:YpdA family putative bacillithiol disulfide reductase [Portibacter lacus]|uniref:Pyridine nucleotide-disulfide oxidoreductase n=1 Tax=Portibacter lacus TaxID=1099794 RepID=A0AA37SPB2_9BACT|nr:YpdA family putative bacillithiol disulfide reductase [Portibacter lacus]GLR16248.1 pyridine nucleotide-disulfide oxidoreductase [Portibacter lacus]
MDYDVIIIGGGPTGLNCAIAAHKENLSYLIIEKGVLVNSIYHFPINMTFFSTSPVLEIGGIPFISHGDKPTRREALEYYRRIVETFDMNIHLLEEVKNIAEKEAGFDVVTNKGQYSSANIIVSTGYYDTPRLLDIPGEQLPKVKHYYDDPHVYIGMDVLVIGAANSACDVALECHYKGANVTMAVRGDDLYAKVKYWIRPNIENRIKEGSIKAYFNTTVKEIKDGSVILVTPEGEIEIKNDFVLAMTGYLPDYNFLRKLGLEVNTEENCVPAHNDESLESNIPGVYVAGVICAGLRTNKLFIENTRDHGEKIISDIVKKREHAEVV